MSKVRINDLARELEVKSRPILDALEAIGVSGKTHSSSIEAEQAERVRDYFNNPGARSSAKQAAAARPEPGLNLGNIQKPGPLRLRLPLFRVRVVRLLAMSSLPGPALRRLLRHQVRRHRA
jgi:hypothetical protein